MEILRFNFVISLKVESVLVYGNNINIIHTIQNDHLSHTNYIQMKRSCSKLFKTTAATNNNNIAFFIQQDLSLMKK